MKKQISLAAIGFAAAMAVPAFAGPGLADGAAKFVGNITQSNTAPGPNDEFTKLWNQATAENGCKWGSVEGTRGRFNWDGCDAAYQWAKRNGGHFKFHALIWGSQYPGWLNGLSVDDTKKAITTWFDAVKQRYPDIEIIDVVNEAIRGEYKGENWSTSYHSCYGPGNNCSRNNIAAALGGDNGKYDFITTAFKMARERWPKAILVYNDYNTIQWNVDQGIDLINTIRKNGAPVDAYGLQAHDLMSEGGNGGGTGGGGYCMNYNSFKSTMEKIHKQTNNIPILISEYDVPSTDDGIQKQCYQEQFKYWMEDPLVAGITIWGYLYGHTWLNCNGKANGCSGIIRDGQDRPALTWMKEYLRTNKGVNSTGLATGVMADPEPQTPFDGKAATIPGKIEAEKFDVPGVGYGTASYSDTDVGNNACADNNKTKAKDCATNYRPDTDVDIKTSGTGYVVGWGATDEWLEYTVDVTEAGTYSMFAAASSGGGGSYKLSLVNSDGTLSDLTKTITVAAAANEDDFDNFAKNSVNVNFEKAGKQIIRFTIVKGYVDFDYMTFVAGADAEDPEPIVTETQPSEGAESGDKGEDNGEEMAIAQDLHMNMNVLQAYDIFDMQGVFMGRIRGYSFDQAVDMVKSSTSTKLAKGVYYIRNKDTKQMQNFKITK
ncbi:endo-1,4-beta-xylanase [Fibrobacter sp.]|uniref:endo-1,4-beta-xylanase n=1 Tax=Fibrobacter sp. TaxID=35828 RepID=UPI00388E47C6